MPKMIDPRGLPCGHICCRLCLSQMYEKGEVVCPECDEILDSAVDANDLPVDYGEDFRCDPCNRKGQMSLASLFCRHCKQKMCERHVEVSQSTQLL